MATQTLKEQHELAVANALLAAIGEQGEWLRFGLAGVEPDVVYRISGRVVGIEIATAYYDEAQAKTEWQLARGALKPHPSGLTPIGSWSEPDRLIAAQLQSELDDKCAKTYSGVDCSWLCVEQHAPLADVAETIVAVAALRVPENHAFQRIYVGAYAHMGDGGGFRVYEVPVV